MGQMLGYQALEHCKSAGTDSDAEELPFKYVEDAWRRHINSKIANPACQVT